MAATIPQKLTDLHPALRDRVVSPTEARGLSLRWNPLPSGHRPGIDGRPLVAIVTCPQTPGIAYVTGHVFNWLQVEWALVGNPEVVAILL